MCTSREAFDLFNPHCRRNFVDGFKRNWKRLGWWQLVISDTAKRTCSEQKAKS
jgi:hypothetical protein